MYVVNNTANIDFYIVGFTVLLSLILGAVIFYRDRKSITGKAFFAFIIINSAWSIANYFSYQKYSQEITLFIIRLVMFFSVWQAYSFYSFINFFPEREVKIRKIWKILFLWTIGVSVLTLTDFVFSGVEINGAGVATPIPAMGLMLFAASAFSYVLLALTILLRKFRRSSGVERTQLKLIGVGLSVMFILIVIFNFLYSIVFNDTSLIPFSIVFTLPFIIFTWIAIVRHRFLDINFLVARVVSYSALTFVLVAIYTLLLYVIMSFARGDVQQEEVIASTILAIILVYSYQPMRRHIEVVTDKIFYQGSYKTDILLADLNRVMASTLILEDLCKKIITKLVNEVKLSRAGLAILDNNSVSFVQKVGFGDDELQLSREDIKDLLGAGKRHSMLVFDSLKNGEKKELMRKYNLSVAVPLSTKEEVIGLLLIGKKSSGDIFSDQDIKLFEILAPELSIAVQNAKSFHEIKRFNVTLKEEVEQATAKLRSANDRLKELDKLKDEFVSIASHELRTPMTAIKYYLWMALSGRGGKVSKKQKYYLERSYNSTNRLINLVNDMLNISRIEAGRIILSPKKATMKEMVQSVLNELEPKASDRHIKINVDQTKIPPVIADTDKVVEVIMNFLGNALKFTPEKGTITISFEEKPEEIITHITDTGVGLSKENLELMFSKFGLVKDSYQANQVVGEGTGLGLYISKSIIELHGGEVSVASEGLGKGSTFSFSLPVYSQRKEAELKKKFKGKDAGIISREVA